VAHLAEKLVKYKEANTPAAKEFRFPKPGGGFRRLTITSYAYDEKAPYLISMVATRQFLIPNGDSPDHYVFELIVTILHEKNWYPKRPDIVKLLCKSLEEDKNLFVVDMVERVTTIVQNSPKYTELP
jgi:hypothetical protein